MHRFTVRDLDLMKLMMSDYKVETINDSTQEFYVHFHGPKDSPYVGGVWKIKVELPDAYPYKSPSIGFMNKIYHPNIDERSGSVCLDVINQTWSPMFGSMNSLSKKMKSETSLDRKLSAGKTIIMVFDMFESLIYSSAGIQVHPLFLDVHPDHFILDSKYIRFAEFAA